MKKLISFITFIFLLFSCDAVYTEKAMPQFNSKNIREFPDFMKGEYILTPNLDDNFGKTHILFKKIYGQICIIEIYKSFKASDLLLVKNYYVKDNYLYHTNNDELEWKKPIIKSNNKFIFGKYVFGKLDIKKGTIEIPKKGLKPTLDRFIFKKIKNKYIFNYLENNETGWFQIIFDEEKDFIKIKKIRESNINANEIYYKSFMKIKSKGELTRIDINDYNFKDLIINDPNFLETIHFLKPVKSSWWD